MKLRCRSASVSGSVAPRRKMRRAAAWKSSPAGCSRAVLCELGAQGVGVVRRQRPRRRATRCWPTRTLSPRPAAARWRRGAGTRRRRHRGRARSRARPPASSGVFTRPSASASVISAAPLNSPPSVRHVGDALAAAPCRSSSLAIQAGSSRRARRGVDVVEVEEQLVEEADAPQPVHHGIHAHQRRHRARGAEAVAALAAHRPSRPGAGHRPAPE